MKFRMQKRLAYSSSLCLVKRGAVQYFYNKKKRNSVNSTTGIGAQKRCKRRFLISHPFLFSLPKMRLGSSCPFSLVFEREQCNYISHRRQTVWSGQGCIARLFYLVCWMRRERDGMVDVKEQRCFWCCIKKMAFLAANFSSFFCYC